VCSKSFWGDRSNGLSNRQNTEVTERATSAAAGRRIYALHAMRPYNINSKKLPEDRQRTDHVASTTDLTSMILIFNRRQAVVMTYTRSVSTFHIDDLCRSALTDALLRLFGTHGRKLSLLVTPLLCSTLG